MTGWRIGYAAGDKEVISAMSKLQGQSTSNPTSISQWAAVAAFTGPHDVISDRTKEFEQRKNYIVQKLNDIPEISCFSPQGGLFMYSPIYPDTSVKSSMERL